jgi:hypothetical protein
LKAAQHRVQWTSAGFLPIFSGIQRLVALFAISRACW